jgi:putative peptidoglycan lipid II flippase
MIKKLFNGEIDSISIAAFLVAVSSLTSRILGIFRDRVLAGQFGAGDTLDIYYAAFRIPDLIYNLLILGALSAGFVPIFTSLIKKQKEKNNEAWILASNILNILIVGLAILSLIGIIFAPCFVKLITPGFSGVKIDLTVALTRIMFLSPILLGISSLLGGILQSFKRFFIYSLAPIFYNAGIIIGAVYFVPLTGIYGLAWGVVLGASLHMLIQIPAVFKLGYKYNFCLNFKNNNIKAIWLMMIPRTMSLGVAQINLVAITIIASTLASGSLSVFNFANNLQSFPVGIFGVSFALAAFPTLATVAFNREKLISNFSTISRQILFFIIPSTVLLLTLRAQIIRIILGTGQFNWEDTILTINTLGFFSFSLFAQALIPLLVRIFYSRHDSKTPFYIGFFSVIINIILSLWLSRKMGIAGLALAFSSANILNFIFLWLALRLELGSLDEIKILKATLKFSLAALFASFIIQGLKLIIAPLVDMNRLWGILTQGAIAAVAGIVIYLLFCYFLKSEELFNFWASIKKRLWKTKIEIVDRGEARGI